MSQVTFKTLDSVAIHKKLLAVGDRLHVISEVIDKWNEAEVCSVLPILDIDTTPEMGGGKREIGTIRPTTPKLPESLHGNGRPFTKHGAGYGCVKKLHL